jgi:HemY protein
MLGNLGKQRQARKLLEEGWAGAPHPEIAAAYAELEPDETAAARRTRLQRLAALRPEHEESHIVLAQAAMACGDWEEARRQLDAVDGAEPDARYCRLMADLTERSGGDAATVRYWLRRAAGARLYATWVCDECGRQSRAWAPHCPDCHAFDSFEWRSPAAAPPPLLTEVAPEPEEVPEPVAQQAPAPAQAV